MLFVQLLLSSQILMCLSVFRKNAITIRNNGFENILIAIHDDVKESDELIAAIKTNFTSASKFLYNATRHRAHFRNIRILVPQTWSHRSQYRMTMSEYFYNADIKINPFSSVHRNEPTVKTYRGCGEPGEYMQISDKFLLDRIFREDFGPTEKSLVHEWAHLRWGVFDEYPHEDDDIQFYFSTKSRRYKPVKCTNELKGLVLNLVERRLCKPNDIDGGYDKNCQFLPYVNQTAAVANVVAEASLMDRQYVNTIQHFCESNGAPGLKHNAEAPNDQNLLCGQRGTWDVISNTADFVNNTNPPQNFTNDDLRLIPTFTIIKNAGYTRVVLMLDDSKSTNNSVHDITMLQAVVRVIKTTLTQGTEIGVITFASDAKQIVPLTKLMSDFDRDSIIQLLPLLGKRSNTSIGNGLQMAMKMLNNSGAIVVISKNQENKRPYISDVINQLIDSDVVVHCLGLSQNADQALSTLATSTGGQFLYAANTYINGLNFILGNIANLLNSASSSYSPETQFFAYSKNYHAGETTLNSTYLYNGLGNKTTLTISFVTSAPSFAITSPSGVIYDNNYSLVQMEFRSKMIFFTIPGIAEYGKWMLKVTNTDSLDQHIATSFVSTPKLLGDATLLTVRIIESAGTLPIIRIIAEATMGGKSIIGLNVTATCTSPNGSLIYLRLVDNGRGADHKANDGIYSRYFTTIQGAGRYSFSVMAQAHPNTSQLVIPRAGQSGSIRLDPTNITDEIISRIQQKEETKATIIKNEINAVSSGEAVEFAPTSEQEKLLFSGDVFPPNRIQDLKVLSTNSDKATVKFEFTAPGDDYDEGTATRYHVLYKNQTSDWKYLKELSVLSGTLTLPKPSGETEQFEILVPYKKHHNMFITIALQAEDKSSNKSPMSNFVSFSFGEVSLVRNVVPTKLSSRVTSLPDEFKKPALGTNGGGVITKELKQNMKVSLLEHYKMTVVVSSIVGGLIMTSTIVIALILTKQKQKKIYSKLTI